MLVALIATVAFSYLLQGRGFLGMLPILLAAIAGYVLTLLVVPAEIDFKKVAEAQFVVVPNLTWSGFRGPLVITAVFSIGIMATATIYRVGRNDC